MVSKVTVRMGTERGKEHRVFSCHNSSEEKELESDKLNG